MPGRVTGLFKPGQTGTFIIYYGPLSTNCNKLQRISTIVASDILRQQSGDFSLKSLLYAIGWKAQTARTQPDFRLLSTENSRNLVKISETACMG